MKFITVIAAVAAALGVAFDFGLARFDLALTPKYTLAVPAPAAKITETAMAASMDAEPSAGADGVLP